jgi:hypothetical protein
MQYILIPFAILIKDVLSILSIINNQQEPFTPLSNINKEKPSDELIDCQVMSRHYQW